MCFFFSFQGAWSKSDPEKGIRSAEDEEKEKKRKALQVRARHMFLRILRLRINKKRLLNMICFLFHEVLKMF